MTTVMMTLPTRDMTDTTTKRTDEKCNGHDSGGSSEGSSTTEVCSGIDGGFKEDDDDSEWRKNRYS